MWSHLVLCMPPTPRLQNGGGQGVTHRLSNSISFSWDPAQTQAGFLVLCTLSSLCHPSQFLRSPITLPFLWLSLTCHL